MTLGERSAFGIRLPAVVGIRAEAAYVEMDPCDLEFELTQEDGAILASIVGPYFSG